MIDNKSRFSQTLEKAANVFIIIMPVFSVGYFLWMRYSIPLVFYVSNYRDISTVGVFVLIIGYISTIGLLIYTKGHHKSKIRMMGIVIFIITVLLFCISTTIFISLPTVLDKAQILNTTYYLTGITNDDGHFFRDLYKCKNNQFACEKTPFFSGGGTSVTHWHLMIDKTTDPNEINVISSYFDGSVLLEYTYGAQPRYYDYPAQLNDRLYYLAHYYNPEPKTTTFLLYECDLDNTSCKQLPIRYVGFGYLRDTVADESTGEINAFIDDQMEQDTLIFTWGKNPQCFVDGCEILDTQN